MNKIAALFTRLNAFIAATWQKIPPGARQWIKGAEVAVVTAIVAGFTAAPASDFTTKKGIAEFAAGIAATAYGALRLYMTQSPVQNVIKKTVESETLAIGDVSKTTTVSETTSTGGDVGPIVVNQPKESV